MINSLKKPVMFTMMAAFLAGSISAPATADMVDDKQLAVEQRDDVACGSATKISCVQQVMLPPCHDLNGVVPSRDLKHRPDTER